MKSVLISIQPKWCELIASGKKTIEVRKTIPKLLTPFKVYIYQTKESKRRFLDHRFNSAIKGITHHTEMGKVIGEFVCDKIDEFSVPYPAYFSEIDNNTKVIIENACLKPMDIHGYNGTRQTYAWHISDLVIYDKPRKLSEFLKATKVFPTLIHDIAEEGNGSRYNKFYYPLKRPPQSWCYVESEDTQ